MEKIKTNLQLKVIVPVLGVLIALSVVVVYSERHIEFGKLHDQHLADVRRAEWLMTEKINNDAVVYSVLSEQLCQNTAFQQAFVQRDRQALLELAEPIYAKLNSKYNVRHLYFHQLDKTCFLRVHNPSRFGDVIARHTLDGAIRRDEPFHGLELGWTGTLRLRHVRPWRVDGKLIGFVELGQEIDTIVQSLKSILDFEFVTTIDKSLVDRTAWQKGLQMLGRTGHWDLLDDMVITGNTLEGSPAEFVDSIQRICLRNKTCYQTPLVTINDKEGLTGCFDLTDAGGTQVGRMFVIHDVSVPAAVIAQSSLFFGAMIIVAGFLVSIFFYFYIGRIERCLEETDRKQRTEIANRRFAEAQLIEIRRRLETSNADLRQAQQKLQLHIDQTPLGVIRWDTNLRIESWNAAAEQMFGFTAEEALGRVANDLILPKDVHAQVEDVRQNLLSQNGGTNERNENVTKAGRRIMCHWHNTPLVDSEGRVIGVSSIVQDVTKEIEYEQQLQQAKEQAESANRYKSEFLANMTHELRTPMNAILGFSDLLRTEPLTARQIDYVSTIHTSGQHLLSLINNVLDMSKIEAGKEQVVMAACSLRPLLGQVEDLMRISAESKGLQFELEISDDVPGQVVTDARHLYQMLINLLGNAIKFTEQGSVSLRVGLLDTDADPCLCLKVIDTGVGIPADRRAKIFESFEQADASTSRRYGGTGLGLAISQKLVTMMGGALAVDSEEGVGSTFTITLPLEPVPQPV